MQRPEPAEDGDAVDLAAIAEVIDRNKNVLLLLHGLHWIGETARVGARNTDITSKSKWFDGEAGGEARRKEGKNGGVDGI